MEISGVPSTISDVTVMYGDTTSGAIDQTFPSNVTSTGLLSTCSTCALPASRSAVLRSGSSTTVGSSLSIGWSVVSDRMMSSFAASRSTTIPVESWVKDTVVPSMTIVASIAGLLISASTWSNQASSLVGSIVVLSGTV